MKRRKKFDSDFEYDEYVDKEMKEDIIKNYWGSILACGTKEGDEDGTGDC